MTANTNYPNLNASKVASVWGMSHHQLLDEGCLFVATNPTIGTAIATTTSVVDAANAGATSAQTRPVSIIHNQNGASSNIMVYPLTWNMKIVQVPTTASVWNMACWLEPVGSNAYSNGGSDITPVALNQLGSVGTSKARILFGALVANATTSGGKLVALRQINSAIPVTLDQWLLTFGSARGGDQISGGAGAKNIHIALPPIAIPPQWALKMGMWGAANAAAPSWEFELVYAERGMGQ